jgi:ATP-binding cassette subfamily B (MDR/TAP) protein 1
MTARQGEFVAVVGASGSGKSTLLALLERFYDPEAGTVTVDGRSVASYRLSQYRNQIGLVGQETELFSGTVWDNLIVGLDGVSQEEVDQACHDADIYDLIVRSPFVHFSCGNIC